MEVVDISDDEDSSDGLEDELQSVQAQLHKVSLLHSPN